MSVANDSGNVCLQPYEGWWVSHTMTTVAICFDELLCLLQMTVGIFVCSLTRGGGCHAAWPGSRCTSTWVIPA